MRPTTIIVNMTVVAVMLIGANYAYQAFGPGDWMAAAERSIFQFVAIGCCCVSMIAANAADT